LFPHDSFLAGNIRISQEANMLATATYQGDIAAWAMQQAAFLRAKNFEALDLENLAEEIEDVSKSEKRELRSRMAVLLAHLLKWQIQPQRIGASWEITIKAQRIGIAKALQHMPSLKPCLADPDWLEVAWGDAVSQASQETQIQGNLFPGECPWSMAQVLDPEFFPA
jgi:hypothetical protein